MALLPRADGVVTLRAVQDGDATVLVAERDEEFHRWLGPGSPEPRPTAVIEVDGEVVGWVDHDDERRAWLESHQCNVGYHVFPSHRGRGIAARAVRLLLDLLRDDGTFTEATFLVDGENEPSLRVCRSVGAVERDRFDGKDGRLQILLAVVLDV